MFRKMRRFKQQLSEEECIEVLKTEGRGVLSVHGEDGYPYGVPINFLYDDGKIYFHGARSGHKIDALKADNRVSFCVYTKGAENPKKVGLDVKSIILFGRISFVEDHDKAMEKARKLGLKYDPADFVETELIRDKKRIQMLELTIDYMTGKLVNES